MIFDGSFITSSFFEISLIVFLSVFVGALCVATMRPRMLRVAHKHGVTYAGAVLALCVALAGAYALHWSMLGVGLIIASVFILIIGIIDERYQLSALYQLYAQLLIACVAVMSGWIIPHVSSIVTHGVIEFGVGISSVLAFVWIITCMNAVNFLDGTDGLAVSTVGIACLALVGISVLPATQDARTFQLGLIGLFGCMAFFLFNAPSARVYLGTTGSWFLGLYIALIAMLGGGKIATTMIVLALPLLDVLFVIWYRVQLGKSPWVGDTTSHIHHRLDHLGFGKWGILVVLSLLTILLALTGVFASTYIKVLVLICIAIVFFLTSSRMMKRI